MEGIQKSDINSIQNSCPVCTSKNETEVQNCATCGWYFPLKDSPHFAIELSRAKQQFQMISTFNQVLGGMQSQAKMLEKVSFRLDGLEGEMNHLKENKPVDTLLIQKYEYPVLKPIEKVADFNTKEKRQSWWYALEEQWKKAFNQAVLRKDDDYQPTDEELNYLLESPTIRMVGPRGMHPSIDFELTNLSGLKHLSELTLLVASHNALADLQGIEHLAKLECLFVNANKLTNLKEVFYLPLLKNLYCNVNQITDLHPIAFRKNLEVLNCQYNRLQNLEGLDMEHSSKLQEFVVLPNENLSEEELERVESHGIKCRKG